VIQNYYDINYYWYYCCSNLGIRKSQTNMSGSDYGKTPSDSEELAFFEGQSSMKPISGSIGGSGSAYGSSSTSSGGINNPFSSTSNMQPMSTSTSSESEKAGDSGVVDYFKKSSNPWASLFHVLFKLSAILTYVFGAWFTNNYVLIFVCCVLLLAFDFWTVKNVTGRLMVGLRWESRLHEDGSSFWVYEALEDKSRITAIDSTIFWGAMWLSPILWASLLVIGILKFNVAWLLIVAVALTLNSINLLGFIRCRKGAKQQAQQAMTSLMTQGVLSGILSAPGLVGSTLFGDGSGNGGTTGSNNDSGMTGGMSRPELVV
jgi:hypothetical protein